MSDIAKPLSLTVEVGKSATLRIDAFNGKPLADMGWTRVQFQRLLPFETIPAGQQMPEGFSFTAEKHDGFHISAVVVLFSPTLVAAYSLKLYLSSSGYSRTSFYQTVSLTATYEKPPIIIDPPIVDKFPLVIVTLGHGGLLVRLYDLFKANGRPERIGYAVLGGYIDAGVRWTTRGADAMWAVGAGAKLTERNGRLYGVWAGGTSPGPMDNARRDAAIQAISVVSPYTQGVPWATAGPWSRAGSWVRRKSWADQAQAIRHEAGPGTVRAVAVLQSTSVTAARPVRNSEFGVAEFAAVDWAMLNPPDSVELDLTDALIAISAHTWVLWKQGQAVIDNSGGGGDGGGIIIDTGGGGDPAVTSGFVYRRNGIDILVPAMDTAGDAWEPQV